MYRVSGGSPCRQPPFAFASLDSCFFASRCPAFLALKASGSVPISWRTNGAHLLPSQAGIGRAVRWMPLRGSTDLPRFVEHFIDTQFKIGLAGRIRMETPVLYFYSPHETTVSVKVGFSKVMITEWYPHAGQVKPDPKRILDREALSGGTPAAASRGIPLRCLRTLARAFRATSIQRTRVLRSILPATIKESNTTPPGKLRPRRSS